MPDTPETSTKERNKVIEKLVQTGAHISSPKKKRSKDDSVKINYLSRGYSNLQISSFDNSMSLIIKN